MPKPSASEARKYKIRGASTLKKLKRTKGSGGDKAAYKAARLVVYCPHCPRGSVDPELDPKVIGPFNHNQRLVCPRNAEHVFYAL